VNVVLSAGELVGIIALASCCVSIGAVALSKDEVQRATEFLSVSRTQSPSADILWRIGDKLSELRSALKTLRDDHKTAVKNPARLQVALTKLVNQCDRLVKVASKV